MSASYLKIMSGAALCVQQVCCIRRSLIWCLGHVRPLAQSFIKSEEKPTKGTAQGVQQRHPVYYLFDHHYTLANREVQVLLKRPKTVQNIGPQRKRSDLNKGEDNAVYKAYFHSCIQCAGADDCASPLMYRPLLYRQINDIDKYLAILPTTPGAQRIATRFLYSMEGSPLRDLYAGRPRCIEARSISSRRPR